MLRRRSVWLVAVMGVAVMALLAFSRGSERAAPVVEASATTYREAVAQVEAPAPRHPEIGFRGREQMRLHFRKHGREFGAKSAGDYLRLAQSLRDRPRGGGVIEFVRNDAVTCKFDRATGAFVAYNSDGTLRTFFRPTDGEAYFDRQKARAHEPR